MSFLNCLSEMRCTSNGNVRLVNGSVEREGRVEVCWEGVWYAACNISWSQQHTDVVCQQLGYGGAGMHINCT